MLILSSLAYCYQLAWIRMELTTRTITGLIGLIVLLRCHAGCVVLHWGSTHNSFPVGACAPLPPSFTPAAQHRIEGLWSHCTGHMPRQMTTHPRTHSDISFSGYTERCNPHRHCRGDRVWPPIKLSPAIAYRRATGQTPYCHQATGQTPHCHHTHHWWQPWPSMTSP